MTEIIKPCGEYHPLPCALDEKCPIPVEYHDSGKTNQEIKESYERQSL